MEQDVGIADQHIAGKQGRDGSIKQFSIQLHPVHTYLQCGKYEKVMGWCTAQCKMLLFCMKTIVKAAAASGNFLTWYFHDAF